MKRDTLWLILAALALIAASVTTAVVVYNQSRGLRNNNPGNIRKSATGWQGMSIDQSGDSAFVQFASPVYGIRAMGKILTNYMARGINTIQDIVSTWAPSVENDTAAYIAAVSRQTGIAAGSMVTSADLPALVNAIITHENGINPYPPELIQQGIGLA